MSQDLSQLPRDEDGVRQRGLEMTRIEVFTDAAFAFAVTMLVVSVDTIPSDIDELMRAMLGIPAFALSFLQVMVFWYAHHIWSRRYGMDDIGTVVLSSLLVLIVLVFIYPLKTTYSSALAWATDSYLPSEIALRSYTDLGALFTVFGLSYLAMSLAILLLYRHAWKQRDALQLDAREALVTKLNMGTWACFASPAVLSLIIANTIETGAVVFAGIIYSVLGVLMPLWGRYYYRRITAVEPDA